MSTYLSESTKHSWAVFGFPETQAPVSEAQFSVSVNNSWSSQASFHIFDIEEIIDRKVQEKLDTLLKEKTIMNFRAISETEALKEIKSFLLKKKAKGIFRVSVLDLILELKLPGEQVDNIMSKFIEGGSVKEI